MKVKNASGEQKKIKIKIKKVRTLKRYVTALHRRNGVGQVPIPPRLRCGWPLENGACSLCPEREVASWGPRALGLRLAEPTNYCFPAAQPSMHMVTGSHRFSPSVVIIILQRPRVTQPPVCAAHQRLQWSGTAEEASGSLWPAIRAATARRRPSPAAARRVARRLPPGNTGPPLWSASPGSLHRCWTAWRCYPQRTSPRPDPSRLYQASLATEVGASLATEAGGGAVHSALR